MTQLFYILAGVALGLLLPLIPVGFTVHQAGAAQMLFAVGAGQVEAARSAMAEIGVTVLLMVFHAVRPHQNRPKPC